MQNERSQEINKRFFEVVEFLILKGALSNQNEFLKMYDIDIGHFCRWRREPQREFPMHLLAILVSDYNISGDWLLIGKGQMFKTKAKTVFRARKAAITSK